MTQKSRYNYPMPSRKNTFFVIVLISLLVAALLSACGAGNRTPAATSTPEATPIPPTPTASPAEIIWVSAQTSGNDALTKTITDFASANSLQYRTLTTLTPTDITSGTKIVVLQAVPDNFSSLATGATSTQFILLGSSTSADLANVSTIQAKPEDEAFMAGYLTMLIAQDWRVGALVTSDGPLGSAYADDFANGSKYVCGKCNAFYAPLVAFPAVTSEASSSPASTWSGDASAMAVDMLSAAFLDPAAANTDVVTALNNQTLNATTTGESIYLISTDAAPQDGSISWTALLTADYASSLKTLLPQVLAGQGKQNVSAQVGLTDVNQDVVSPAKQALFAQTAADLASGNLLPTTVQ